MLVQIDVFSATVEQDLMIIQDKTVGAFPDMRSGHLINPTLTEPEYNELRQVIALAREPLGEFPDLRVSGSKIRLWPYTKDECTHWDGILNVNTAALGEFPDMSKPLDPEIFLPQLQYFELLADEILQDIPLGMFPDLRSGCFTSRRFSLKQYEDYMDYYVLGDAKLGDFPDLRDTQGPALVDREYFRE